MGLFEYISETRGEMKHVSWPTRKQTIMYTTLVILISAIVAMYLGALDFLFREAFLSRLLGVSSTPQTSTPAETTEGSEAVGVPSEEGESSEEPQFDISVDGTEVTPTINE
ncbi:MAG: preprotein translocase subunit SecE [Candidatus Paceibacterota bacterium]